MQFSDFIIPAALLPRMKAADKPGVIEELVAALCSAGAVDEEYHEEIVATLLRREEFGSTGLGNGFAFPHARHEAATRSVGTVGIHRDGIDFESLDGRKSRVIFLLLSPPEKHTDHLKMLEMVSRWLRDGRLGAKLLECETAEEMREIFEAADGAAGS